MNTLKSMPAVMAALGKIASKGTIQYDNGTFGKTVKCILWDVEVSTTEEAKKLMDTIVIKKLTNEDYTQEAETLAKMETTERTTLVFKLMEPMYVSGTKVMEYKGKNISPVIKNCTEFYVPQEIANRGLVTYKETGETSTDAQGQEVPVVEMTFNGCILDVKEGRRDFFQPTKWNRAPRAYLTDISFRSMQIVGKMLNRENNIKRNAMNFIDDSDLNLF